MNPSALLQPLLSDHISANAEEEEKKICGICVLLCFPKLPEKCVSANRRVQCFSNCPNISSPLLKYLIFSCRQNWLIQNTRLPTHLWQSTYHHIHHLWEHLPKGGGGHQGIEGNWITIFRHSLPVYATMHCGNTTSQKSVAKHCDTIQYDNIRFSHYTIYNMLWNILWQFAKTITILDCVNSVLHNIAANSPFYQVLSFCRVCVYLVFESCISLPAAYNPTCSGNVVESPGWVRG